MQFEIVLKLPNRYFIKDVHLNYTGVVETKMQWFLMKNAKPKSATLKIPKQTSAGQA